MFILSHYPQIIVHQDLLSVTLSSMKLTSICRVGHTGTQPVVAFSGMVRAMSTLRLSSKISPCLHIIIFIIIEECSLDPMLLPQLALHSVSSLIQRPGPCNTPSNPTFRSSNPPRSMCQGWCMIKASLSSILTISIGSRLKIVLTKYLSMLTQRTWLHLELIQNKIYSIMHNRYT